MRNDPCTGDTRHCDALTLVFLWIQWQPQALSTGTMWGWKAALEAPVEQELCRN